MKTSTSWIVPAGFVFLFREGVLVAKVRLRERIDGIDYDEIVLNAANVRDATSVPGLK